MLYMYVRVSLIYIEFKVLMLYAAADNQFVTLAQCFAYQNSIKSGTHTHTYIRIFIHSATVAFTWLQLQLEFAGWAGRLQLRPSRLQNAQIYTQRIGDVCAYNCIYTSYVYMCVCVYILYFCMNYELCKLCTHTHTHTATVTARLGPKLCVHWARGT